MSATQEVREIPIKLPPKKPLTGIWNPKKENRGLKIRGPHRIPFKRSAPNIHLISKRSWEEYLILRDTPLAARCVLLQEVVYLRNHHFPTHFSHRKAIEMTEVAVAARRHAAAVTIVSMVKRFQVQTPRYGKQSAACRTLGRWLSPVFHYKW